MNGLLQKRKATDVRKQEIAHHLAEECLEERDTTYMMLHCASPKANKDSEGGWLLPLHLHSLQSGCAEMSSANAGRAHTGQSSLD